MRAFIVCAALLFLVACMPGNYEGGQRAFFDQSKVAQIQKGVSTMQNVAALFGDPQERHFQENGGETWTYSYQHTEWSPLEVSLNPKSTPASLEISFDRWGIVQEYAVNKSGS